MVDVVVGVFFWGGESWEFWGFWELWEFWEFWDCWEFLL